MGRFTWLRSRAGFLLTVVVLVMVCGALFLQYQRVRSNALEELGVAPTAISDVDIQFAGDAQGACEVVGGAWSEGDRTCTLPEGRDVPAAYQRSLQADWWFIGAYGIALAAGCVIAWRLLDRRRNRNLGRAGTAGVLLVVVCDASENLLLRGGLEQLAQGAGVSDVWFQAAGPLAAIKFAVGATAAAIAVIALLVTLVRAAIPASKITLKPEDIILPAPHLSSTGERHPDIPWQSGSPSPPPRSHDPRTRWHNARVLPPGRAPAAVGISASGGGIRSACFTLGALQSLREAGELQKARYLVSVSGGGYMAGAFQLALNSQKGAASGDAPSAGEVFAPGSVEEDHLRRHGKYIAAKPREWVAALLVLLRNVVASLGLLITSVVLVGLTLSALYAAVPIVELDEIIPVADGSGAATLPGLLTVIPTAVWLSLAAALGTAGLVWFTFSVWLGWTGRVSRLLLLTATALAAVGGLVAVLGVAVPALVWTSAWVGGGIDVAVDTAGAVVSGAVGTSLLTYLGALVMILWRKRERIGSAGRLFGRVRSGVQPLEREVATGLGQVLIVWAILLILAAVFLLILGFVVGTGSRWHPGWWVGLPVGLGLVALLFDQTWLSLHPFYRRRLASAFAVRRVRLEDGAVAALPYNFVGERTALSRYGRRFARFPQVIFAGAAALSGNERTPPGRGAVSYTFSYDYVGGPDVGWVKTAPLEGSLKPNLRSDLTVQAAQAISGAAFASTMGRHAGAYQTLLALSNARLGAWMPNPVFLDRVARAGGDWTLPRLPGVRRLPYLIREVVGSYPEDERFLLCTDGGHYENLGLVELLRHGCQLIYCIDASGDAPPFATTLAEAIALAWEELGVRIVLDDPTDLVPGSAEPLKPPDPLSALNARLSKHAVVTGKITYPEPLRFGSGRYSTCGRLVVAKAALTPEMPYDLLAYAVANPTFPRRSTGDQFFDVGQFDAYQGLGRYLGARAARAAYPDPPPRRRRLGRS